MHADAAMDMEKPFGACGDVIYPSFWVEHGPTYPTNLIFELFGMDCIRLQCPKRMILGCLLLGAPKCIMDLYLPAAFSAKIVLIGG
jgi:hypothetical protein